MDNISPERRSANMRAIRSKNTTPEMVVRRLLHHMGYRFRLHRKDLPGKPDIVLPRFRTVIFVHGCFWHQHPDPSCTVARLPKTNAEYWLPKLRRNRERDIDNQIQLENSGWSVVTIWECETKKTQALKNKISSNLKNLRAT